jgi:hypothetical protein
MLIMMESDVVIGAPFAAGKTYIVFGKKGGYSSPVNLNTTSEGLVIYGASTYDQSGLSVSSCGDFNNDGITDVVIGAYYASPFKRAGAGTTYVVYGKK